MRCAIAFSSLVSYPLVIHLDAEELLAEKTRAIPTRSKGKRPI
jgi:hypothetical protein